MSTNFEIDGLDAGAADIHKEQQAIEEKIRKEVTTDYSHMPPEAQEAIIKSRVGIISNQGKPMLKKVDLGENASRKVKDNLFE